MARVLLGIRGMDNEGDAGKVKETLLAVDGVQKVEASRGQAAVEYDPADSTITDLIRALRRVGFSAGME